MEKILLIGLILAIIFGAGAVGAVMTSGSNYGMMGDYNGMMGNENSHMMNSNEMHSMHEDCEEYMGEECDEMSDEECEYSHEDCDESMNEYCEHEETGLSSNRIGYNSVENRNEEHSCPMM
jgi:hypothetical protein